MKFLQELVRFKRMDDDELEDDDLLDDLPGDEYDDPDAEDFSDDLPNEDDLDGLDDEDSVDDFPSNDGEEFDNDELEDGQPIDDFDTNAGDELGDEGMEDLPDDEPVEPEDPDRQGLIRKVNKAHLVYKRTTDDGTYEEMWMYNVSNLRDSVSIRKAILSGTDIPPNRTQSEDGSQSYELWTAGNAEMMVIKGLPQ